MNGDEGKARDDERQGRYARFAFASKSARSKCTGLKRC
jgi:hypothetical protein